MAGTETISQFQKKHAASRKALDSWTEITRKQDWHNGAEMHATFPHADIVGKLVIFNIAGNRYRLVAKVNFQFQIVEVREVLTHAEYSKRRF